MSGFLEALLSPIRSASSDKTPADEDTTIRDLYDSPDVAKNPVLKPMTAEPNHFAPQEGVHLYHFHGSFYSYEARLMLEEKGVAWTSHPVCIAAGVYDQYDPDYVRINPRCVVPTLVVDGKVTTDAHNMLKYAEDVQLGGPDAPKLIPAEPDAKKLVLKYFDLAAGIFVESLTFGNTDDCPEPPFYMKPLMGDHHESKRKCLKEKIEEFKDDPYLLSAYETKLKLMNEMCDLVTDEEKLREIIASTSDAIALLNEQLENGPAKDGVESWLCGDYSIADLQWSLVLYRLDQRGWKEKLWGEYPAVEAYKKRLVERPAFKRAVVEWNNPLKMLGLLVSRKVEKLFKVARDQPKELIRC